MADRDESSSTIPSEDAGSRWPDRILRFFTLVLVSLVCLTGVSGLLGIRTGHARGTGDGIALAVEHAAITRGGLATPFGVTVTASDGATLPPRLTITINSSYLEIFDENGLDPLPVASSRTADQTHWTFESPEGSTELSMSFDARLEPGVQWGQDGTVSVEVDGRRTASARFRTWVLP